MFYVLVLLVLVASTTGYTAGEEMNDHGPPMSLQHPCNALHSHHKNCQASSLEIMFVIYMFSGVFDTKFKVCLSDEARCVCVSSTLVQKIL